MLAGAYAEGRGAPQSDVEAVKWYLKAADQGYAPAQLNLGTLYAKGRGVPLDYVQAYVWFSLSAAQGIPQAGKNRELAARLMTPAQIAEAEALVAAWKPKTGP
jgi:TPR repeat protein